jgi:hypothetical protein
MGTSLRTFAGAGALLVLLTAAAAAQGVGLGTDGVAISPFKQQERKLTPDEIEKQQQLDDAYKAATNKIPDQKSNDPWAVVRPTAPSPAPKKKPQQ